MNWYCEYKSQDKRSILTENPQWRVLADTEFRTCELVLFFTLQRCQYYCHYWKWYQYCHDTKQSRQHNLQRSKVTRRPNIGYHKKASWRKFWQQEKSTLKCQSTLAYQFTKLKNFKTRPLPNKFSECSGGGPSGRASEYRTNWKILGSNPTNASIFV